MFTFAISSAAIATGCHIATTVAYCSMCAGITATLFSIGKPEKKSDPKRIMEVNK